MKSIVLALVLGCLCGCGETVRVMYRDGSATAYKNVANFRCLPAACASGPARAISFTVGGQCVVEGDFLEAVHTWHDQPEPCPECWWYDAEGVWP